MEESNKRNEISQLGKYQLINKLREQFTNHHASTAVSFDDDASVVDFGNKRAVFSSKLFLEHIHFDLTYFPLRHLGYKCTSIVISDILGMNALQTHLTVNLAVSNRFSVEALEELMLGIRTCCEHYEVDLVKLDVTSSAVGLAISMSGMGEVSEQDTVLRKGTKENELICVSGDFAAAYTGLLLLQREKQIFEATQNSQPDFEGYEYLLQRQLKPEPRVDVIADLKKNGIVPTTLAVVSEGLAASLLQICNLSSTGCTIFEDKLPIDTLTFDTLKSLKIVATMAALNGGEDYELLFTIRQDDYEKIKKIDDISVIGYMTEKNAGHHLISNDNCQIPLQAQEFASTKNE